MSPAPRPLPLALLAGLVVLGAALGLLPTWPGLIHAVALPPLDLVHDLTLLLARAPSWPSFLLGLAGALLLRVALLATLMGGPSRSALSRSLLVHLVALPLALLAASLRYASGALLFYALFWFGLLAALSLLLLAALPWQEETSLRGAFAGAAGRGFRAGTIGAYLLLLSLLGAIADLLPPSGSLALVPVSAGLTFLTVRVLARDPGGRFLRRTLAAAAGGGLAGLLLVALAGPAGPPLAEPPERSREGSLMLMSGVDSASGSGAILEIDPHAMGWTCDRVFYFSYAGPGQGQPRGLAKCPITQGAPYQPEDTLRSRHELVPFLEAQTGEMPSPGVLATHSQGVWLAWAAAAEGRLPQVETVVLVGAFNQNPVPYPPRGEAAPGRVGRLVLGFITSIPRPGGSTVFEPDSPLGREWLAHPEAIARTLAAPLPEGMRAVSVPSVFDLPLMPAGRHIRGADDACPIPVIHPNLPYSRELQEVVVDAFEGRRLPPCPPWRTAVGPLLRHFSPPTIARGFVAPQPSAPGRMRPLPGGVLEGSGRRRSLGVGEAEEG